MLSTFMKRKNTNTKPTTFVGVDIGKKWLDVSASRTSFRTSNTASGHRKLVELSAKRGRQPHFICEPGSYGRKLVRFLRAQKHIYSIVSAYRVRQFAKARGQEAKTDKIDARMLSLFGQTLRPKPTADTDPKLARLRQLVRRRQQIIEATKVQKHHLETMEGPTLIRGAKRLVQTLELEGRELEAAAVKQVKRTPELRKRFFALTHVDGVGTISALQLMSEVPELGHVSRREIAALVGLAPINHDSGIKTGRRSIRGGRMLARAALYMAAFHASRVNPVLAPFFQRLRARGKPYRVVLVAVMRKLLVHLNSVAAAQERAEQRPLEKSEQNRFV